jgi:uncharacterized protein (DUF1778 family)
MEDLMGHSAKRMTDAQMADWHYAHKAELDAHMDQDEEIPVEYGEKISITMSFRLPAEEADVIRHAASDAHISLSEWIRTACKKVAGQVVSQPRNKELDAAINTLVRDVDRLRQVAHV